MLNALVMVNWGLGLEILKTLDSLGTVRICRVITQHDAMSHDQWFNAVYDFSIRRGFNVSEQGEIDFPGIRRFIEEDAIDIIITHSFMKKIPRSVFARPRYGSINIHTSLLPKYRGPSPTLWVLKNRETRTGLTCHLISDGIDEGDIINQAEVHVEEHDTVETVIEKQKKIIAPFIKEALSLIVDAAFRPKPQPVEGISYAPRMSNKKEPKE